MRSSTTNHGTGISDDGCFYVVPFSIVDVDDFSIPGANFFFDVYSPSHYHFGGFLLDP
jgi:hypothetical protein